MANELQSVTLYVRGMAIQLGSAYAYLLTFNGNEKTGVGHMRQVSENAAVVHAATDGMRALKKPCHVTICTCSHYLFGGIQLLNAGTRYDTHILAWTYFYDQMQRHTIELSMMDKNESTLFRVAELARHELMRAFSSSR